MNGLFARHKHHSNGAKIRKNLQIHTEHCGFVPKSFIDFREQQNEKQNRKEMK